MERYYPSYSSVDIAELDYLINKYNLLPCGGTDFHGLNRPDIEIGSGYDNNMFVPYNIYENIIDRLDVIK